MSYVSKFEIGQLKPDFLRTNSNNQYTLDYNYELPLISFSDVQNSVNLSLVYSYERYKDDRANGRNSFSIAPGFKLNLQKRLICDQLDIPLAFQGEDGKNIDLNDFIDKYTFSDDSQRILRKIQQTVNPPLDPGGDTPDVDGILYDYILENSDFSREKYNELGRIEAVYDKYSDNPVLTYGYNESNQLTSITLRGSKAITLSYINNQLKTITYAGKQIKLNYVEAEAESDRLLKSVEHYTGVTYTFTLPRPDFYVQLNVFSYEGNFKVDASENGVSKYSKELVLDEQGTTLKLIDKVENNQVNLITYKTHRKLMESGIPLEYVDTTDNNGVQTRMQIQNKKPFCSYELNGNDPQFTGSSTTSKFTGNVALYNAPFNNTNDKTAGMQGINDGMLMAYDTGLKQWSKTVTQSGEKSGYFTLSGWIKSSETYSLDLCLGKTSINLNESAYCNISLRPLKEWKYFSVTFALTAATVYACFKIPDYTSFDTFEMRDFRLTYHGKDLNKQGEELSSISLAEDVLIELINPNNVVPFSQAQFCYAMNGYYYPILLDEDSDGVTLADVIKFKLRKKREGLTNEVYYNHFKSVVTGTEDLLVAWGGTYYSITDFDIGTRVISDKKTTLTRINFYEYAPTQSIVKTYSVNGVERSREILDNNYDVIESNVEGYITKYVRNEQGQITCETVGEMLDGSFDAMRKQTTTYTDTLITVNEINPRTNQTISTTRHYIDSVWGGTYKVEIPNDSVVIDTYSSDKSSLTQRAFDANSTSKHIFGYTRGLTSSITHGALDYDFYYASGTNELARVTKNNVDIEAHARTRSSGETTVVSSYPSSGSPVYTETTVFDKYDRLKSIAGVLKNSYDINPAFNSSGIHTLAGPDGKNAMLSQTEDALTGEVTKYGYNKGNLTAVKTYNSSNVLQSQEGFTYDKLNRLTKDNYTYNASDSVTSELSYLTSESDELTDNRVSIYSYKVNGATKAVTSNAFDTYKRLRSKYYEVRENLASPISFHRTIEYDGARISSTVDELVNSTTFVPVSDEEVTSYAYDDAGRINAIGYTTYAYDKYGQLTRENNFSLDKTYVYLYNEDGNVIKVQQYAYTTAATPMGTATEKTYTYDTTHPDRLINYNGTAISYNSIGCPTTYKGYTATWTKGKLSKLNQGTIKTGTYTYNYSYNAFGQRTSRSYRYMPASMSGTSAVVKGTLLSYNQSFKYDEAGRLICENKSSTYYQELGTSEKIVYLYDEASVIGFVYTLDGVSNTYYLQRNLLGDVVGIYNTSGTKVGGYTYDAWGNCKITQNTGAIASVNPIRYRGYYYDADMNLYYLNARYYSPEWRRFISPDDTAYLDPENVNGLNLYTYCANDPINRYDPSGCAWDTVLDVAFIAWGIYDLIDGGYKDWKNWVALGVDIAFAAIPFVPSGASQVVKVGNKIDNAVDVASAINKIDNIQDMSKVTMIGRSMDRVTDTATLIEKADHLYDAWKGYDATATGLKRVAHNGISMLHDAGWMFGKLRGGYTVIDIGMTTLHRGRGLYYGAEKFVIGLWKTRNLWKIPINYYF